jgi:CheY-like chemotaxis protein
MSILADIRSREAPDRTVLLVEDDAATLRFYQAGLRGLQGFRQLTAPNGAEALTLVQNQKVDVVVTDLKMPVLDGYSLIAILAEKYPSLPVIVLTSVAEPGSLDRAMKLGAMRVLAKPVRISQLMEEIRTLAAVPPQGMVHGLPLPGLLQLLNWERRTATLTVTSAEGLGYLYVKDGEVIQAAFEQEEGLPCAYRILNWDVIRVEFIGTCRVQPVLDLPLPELLLNAAMEKDLALAAASSDAPPAAAPEAQPEPPGEEPPQEDPPMPGPIHIALDSWRD